MASFLLSCLLATPADAAVSPFLNTPPSYLLQVNGKTYRQKNADTRRAPASLTKMMTGLLVIEQLDLDEVVTVSRGAARETGCRIGLRRGDRLRVRDLLAATLMHSANDACRALADHAAGSEKAFVARMNARARRLHLSNTHFTNACGHDSRGCYSTANDLALLAETAMRNPTFANFVSRRAMRISTVNGRRAFYIKNRNRLIGHYPGARGVKTGTTPNAGQCLVALVERNDRKVLLVILRSTSRWKTAPAMLNAAFAARLPGVGGRQHDRIPSSRADNEGGNSSDGGTEPGVSGNSDNTGGPINEPGEKIENSQMMHDTPANQTNGGKIRPTRELR